MHGSCGCCKAKQVVFESMTMDHVGFLCFFILRGKAESFNRELDGLMTRTATIGRSLCRPSTTKWPYFLVLFAVSLRAGPMQSLSLVSYFFKWPRLSGMRLLAADPNQRSRKLDIPRKNRLDSAASRRGMVDHFRLQHRCMRFRSWLHCFVQMSPCQGLVFEAEHCEFDAWQVPLSVSNANTIWPLGR